MTNVNRGKIRVQAENERSTDADSKRLNGPDKMKESRSIQKRKGAIRRHSQEKMGSGGRQRHMCKHQSNKKIHLTRKGDQNKGGNTGGLKQNVTPTGTSEEKRKPLGAPVGAGRRISLEREKNCPCREGNIFGATDGRTIKADW